MNNFGGDKEKRLNPMEQSVQRIIRWYRTPRKMEVEDVAYQLQKDLQITESELSTIESKIKTAEEEAPKNFYFFIKRLILANRKSNTITKSCINKLCDGSGYIWTNKVDYNGSGTAFKCTCSERESKLPVWNIKLYPDYILEKNSNYKNVEHFNQEA